MLIDLGVQIHFDNFINLLKRLVIFSIYIYTVVFGLIYETSSCFERSKKECNRGIVYV